MDCRPEPSCVVTDIPKHESVRKCVFAYMVAAPMLRPKKDCLQTTVLSTY